VNNKKPRGSLVGLKENREALKVKNTEAMLKVVEKLGKEKPDALWSYKDVWSGAGLKVMLPSIVHGILMFVMQSTLITLITDCP